MGNIFQNTEEKIERLEAINSDLLEACKNLTNFALSIVRKLDKPLNWQKGGKNDTP
jgi:hypothetical protein